MTKYLTADDILAAPDTEPTEVAVPEWGGVVLVRPMTGTERDRFEVTMALAQKSPHKAVVRGNVVARCLVDEGGNRLFTDAQMQTLGEKSAAALDRVFELVLSESGLNEQAVEEAVESFGDAPGAA